MQFVGRSIIFFILSALLISFITKTHHNTILQDEAGTFSCYINGKPFIVDSMKASIRKITGGEKQLSLTNERFVKFTFLNPTAKSINLELSNVREAYIRYEDPASNALGIPVKGYIHITHLDEENKVVSGEFEMDLKLNLPNNSKILKVTNGKFSNIPIVFK